MGGIWPSCTTRWVGLVGRGKVTHTCVGGAGHTDTAVCSARSISCPQVTLDVFSDMCLLLSESDKHDLRQLLSKQQPLHTHQCIKALR